MRIETFSMSGLGRCTYFRALMMRFPGSSIQRGKLMYGRFPPHIPLLLSHPVLEMPCLLPCTTIVKLIGSKAPRDRSFHCGFHCHTSYFGGRICIQAPAFSSLVQNGHTVCHLKSLLNLVCLSYGLLLGLLGATNAA